MDAYFDLEIKMIPAGTRLPYCVEDVFDPGLSLNPISDDQIKQWIERDGEFQWFINIRDNGVHGDGCWLEIASDRHKLLSVLIPDESVSLLAEALQTVIRLRAAQVIREREIEKNV